MEISLLVFDLHQHINMTDIYKFGKNQTKFDFSSVYLHYVCYLFYAIIYSIVTKLDYNIIYQLKGKMS